MAADVLWVSPCRSSLYILIFLLISMESKSDNTIKDCTLERDCFLLTFPEKSFHQVSSMPGDDRYKLTIFCYAGETRSLIKLWKNAALKLEIEDAKFEISFGENASEVEQNHKRKSLWSFLMKVSTRKELNLEVFNTTCVGIYANVPFEVILKINYVEPWYIVVIAFGIILYYFANKWSRNATLHYCTGTVGGVLASLLILAYCISKLMPKKSFAALVLFSGGSITFYFLFWIYYNLIFVLSSYCKAILTYMLFTGIISFLVSYRFGPVTDIRSITIIKWILQLISLILIYNGTQIPEVSVAIIIVLLMVNSFPRCAIKFYRRVSFKFFPPKRSLLTEEEFMNEGFAETQRALQELREFCQSPGCDTWRVVSRLKSPERFSRFVLGNSHITDEEVLQYDSNQQHTLPQDDDTDESDSSAEMNYY